MIKPLTDEEVRIGVLEKASKEILQICEFQYKANNPNWDGRASHNSPIGRARELVKERIELNVHPTERMKR